jgi:mRNA-degrading endonuclease RelE of RelBE toxin-antitoxin system
LDGIDKLAKGTQGLDIKSIKNLKPPQWRLRVGDWRVRFKKREQERVIEGLHIRWCDEAYKPGRER